MVKEALTYDDIQLIPSYSEISTRSSIDLTTNLSKNYKILIPIVASPMDTICEATMAKRMFDLGGVGCIHRFMSIQKQIENVREVSAYIGGALHYGTSIWGIGEDGVPPVMAAIGVSHNDLERAERLVQAGATVLLIDVAHGYHQNVANRLKELKRRLPKDVDIIDGNVATFAVAQYLI